MSNELLVVIIVGEDREGLIADITKPLADIKANIVDINQSTVHGLFSMFLLLDVSASDITYEKAREVILKRCEELSMNVIVRSLSEYEKLKRPPKRELYTVTVLGCDKPGIVHGLAETLGNLGINIERAKMIARGELFAMEMLVGAEEKILLEKVRAILRTEGEEHSVDIIMQPSDMFRREKRLIVFDMDSTVIDTEIINELAKAVGVEKEVSAITSRAMEGRMDFEQSLKERVKLLEGMPVSTLEEIAKNVKLTPTCEELLLTLKEMGYKTALISGGFTYFTDMLKKKFGFDYAYANTLEIENGKLTGKVVGKIIDSAGKGKVVEEIAKKEGLSREEVVAIGDGANDQIMLKNAGLGIAFNAKDVLKKMADGSLAKNNILGLLYCIGADEKRIKSCIMKKGK